MSSGRVAVIATLLFVEIGHKTAGYAHVLAHGPRRVRFRVQVTSQLRKPRIVVNTQV